MSSDPHRESVVLQELLVELRVLRTMFAITSAVTIPALVILALYVIAR